MFTVRHDIPGGQSCMIEAHCVETFPVAGGGIRVVASVPDGSVSNYQVPEGQSSDIKDSERERIWVMNEAGATVAKYLL